MANTSERFELGGRFTASAATAIGEQLHRQAPDQAEVGGDVQLGIEVEGADHRHCPPRSASGSWARNQLSLLVADSLPPDRRRAGDRARRAASPSELVTLVPLSSTGALAAVADSHRGPDGVSSGA